MSEVALAWDAAPGTLAEAAAFAARTIAGDEAYISHGEIQTGLSPDGRHWADDVANMFADDFDDLGAARDLLVGRDPEGRIVAIAVLAREETPRRRFAVIEDMALDPALRSMGTGARMLEMIERRVAEWGIDWLFLESGIANRRAHDFFERHGFAATSHVFAKRLA